MYSGHFNVSKSFRYEVMTENDMDFIYNPLKLYMAAQRQETIHRHIYYTTGMQDLDPKWVRLAPKGTNLWQAQKCSEN